MDWADESGPGGRYSIGESPDKEKKGPNPGGRRQGCGDQGDRRRSGGGDRHEKKGGAVQTVTNDRHVLDGQESTDLAAIIESSLQVSKRHHFFLWAQGVLQRLLPHEIMICGIAHEAGLGLRMHRFSSCRYFDDDHFAAVCHPQEGLLSRMMAAWRRTGRPCVLAGEAAMGNCDPAWEALLAKHELRNIAAHGVQGADGAIKGYFSFSRIPLPLDRRYAYRLEILVPYLHATLSRVLVEEGGAGGGPTAGIAVTAREGEILQWVMEGKTNREIADILSISPLTVKNHMQKIMKKLSVQSRSQAVVRAIALGAIRSRVS